VTGLARPPGAVEGIRAPVWYDPGSRARAASKSGASADGPPAAAATGSARSTVALPAMHTSWQMRYLTSAASASVDPGLAEAGTSTVTGNSTSPV